MGEQAEVTMALLPLTMIDPNKVSTTGKIVLRAQVKEVVGCLAKYKCLLDLLTMQATSSFPLSLGFLKALLELEGIWTCVQIMISYISDN